MNKVELRRISDIEELLRWRREVIENVFGMKPSYNLMQKNKDYYSRHIADGSHIAYVAVQDCEEIGSGSICVTEELPSPDNLSGKCAYLMNIYVRRPFRQHGVGHAIVRKLLEVAQKLDCGKIYLETTEDGRGVYESLGFHDMPDMMKFKS